MSDKSNAKTIVQITSPLEMVGFIKSNGTQCRFVSMVSETEPKLKKNCPFLGVKKVSRKRGMINVNYNKAVCRNISELLGVEVKEVEYTNGEVWYYHLTTVDAKPLPLVINKKVAIENVNAETDFYLQFFPTASENVYKMPNGEIIDEAKLEPYFYSKGERKEFKPCVISIKVENIKELRASGVIMQADDLKEAEAALATA